MLSDLRSRTSVLWRVWLPIALFSLLWLDLFRLLSTQWEAREQYSYGWFVPFFMVYLLWRRWLDRPGGPQAASQKSEARSQRTEASGRSGFNFQPSSFGRAHRFLLFAFCFLLCFSLLPMRVIYEINPDWPLISWLYAITVVLLTLYAFHLADPWSAVRSPWSVVLRRSSNFSFQLSAFSYSPWVRHFAFPICLILLAVVWPWRIEKGLTQGLMKIVASLTVEILGWLNVPAVPRGNLIELSVGVVGVDEACSGIRSFQSSLMVGVVMGELYRLRALPRIGLILGGLLLAFGFNLVRTTLLSWEVSQHGMASLDKWHDPAGLTITVACFLCLWAVAIVMKKRTASGKAESRKQKAEMEAMDAGTQGPKDPETTELRPQLAVSSPTSDLRSLTSEDTPPSASSPTPDLGPLPSVSLSTSGSSASSLAREVRSSTSLGSFQLCRRYLLAVGLWALCVLGLKEAWYRSHQVQDNGDFHWSVALPENNPTFEKIELPARTLNLLAFDLGATGRWQEDDGSEWSLYFFRWRPRSVESIIHSRLHRPDVCLPAAGLRQIEDAGLVSFAAGSMTLPFRKYVYEADASRLYVFFCQWEDGDEHQAGMEDSKQADRLQSVLKGRRFLGQQTMEIIVTGVENLVQAEEQVRERIPQLIRPESATVSVSSRGDGKD